LKAFIGPMLAIGKSPGEQSFKILAARSSMDPSPEVRKTVFGFYHSVGKAFIDALMLACPHIDRKEFAWRLACVYGAMLHIRSDNGRIQEILGDDISFSDPDEALEHVIPFLTAGLSLGALERAGTANVLTRDVGTSQLTEGPIAMSCLVEVERFQLGAMRHQEER
jgi:hypothetical protein